MANNKDVAEAVKSKKAYLGQQTLLLMCFAHPVLWFLAFVFAHQQVSGECWLVVCHVQQVLFKTWRDSQVLE